MQLDKEREQLRLKFLKEWEKNGNDATNAARKVGVACSTGRRWALQNVRGVKVEVVEKVKEVEKEIDPFNAHILKVQEAETANSKDRFTVKQDKKFKGATRFVITSIQNDVQTNKEALDSLLFFAKKKGARFFATACPYNFKPTESTFDIDDQYLMYNNIQINKKLQLMATFNIRPTINEPLAGIDNISKGHSIIIPHPQYEMRTLATMGENPAIVTTTSSISIPTYSKTKTGRKGEFNHSFGAIYVELGRNNEFHIRHLNIDSENGFFDIDGYYHHQKGFTPLEYVEGLVPGDIHEDVKDPVVEKAIFVGAGSAVEKLKPKTVVLHDLLDFNTASHHDLHDAVYRAAKKKFGRANVLKELMGIPRWLAKIDREGMAIKIVGSNHNDHLYKWCTTANIHNDPENAEIFHYLNYAMLCFAKDSPAGPVVPNCLELFVRKYNHGYNVGNVEFLDRNTSFRIKDIELSQHGDISKNGAKGSAKSFATLPYKTIVGHSHSPCVKHGCYQVGTSSLKNLNYVNGASSWMHTFCVIYPNGKRQMINVINGKWHA